MIDILRVRVDLVLDELSCEVWICSACVSDIKLSDCSARVVFVHSIIDAYDILSWILVSLNTTENGWFCDVVTISIDTQVFSSLTASHSKTSGRGE